MTAAVAQDLPSVSPSRMRALRECFLRVAFAQSSAGAGKRTDAQLIGEAAHATLAGLLEPGPPFNERLDNLGSDFHASLIQVAGQRPVRRSRPAAARLRNVATRALAVVAEAGDGSEIRCEQHLSSRDGRIKGIIDLAVISPVLHAIVDYKTGSVLDDEGALAGHLREQLGLYCVLEYERSHRWPDRALILRFGGSPVEWAVDDETCRAIAQEARELRLSYVAHMGTVPPASPSPDACRHCAFAPRCDAFWTALTPQWTEPTAVRGRVVWAERSAAGGVTVKLDDVEGVRGGEAMVQHLSAGLLDRDIEPGHHLAVVGLWVDRDEHLNAGESTRAWIAVP